MCFVVFCGFWFLILVFVLVCFGFAWFGLFCLMGGVNVGCFAGTLMQHRIGYFLVVLICAVVWLAACVLVFSDLGFT